ncbi:MAG: sensor N-terminal transmembrane domain-containing protein [Alphaproteobacteria bacterium]|nr:HAMP domain-containing histidine kinase [Alphaproteobacteria bacterium]MDE2336062.1 sensor N-terminal transmembrane domain-containing protein [Alphaproteobacteria bacterium]
MINRTKRYVSPITLRILAVNLAALLILAFGLLYTGEYERGLIEQAQVSLLAEGRLLSAALAGGGTRANVNGQPILVKDLSLFMLRKLSDRNPLRTIVFGKDGKMLLDSNQLVGPGGAIEMVPLDAPYDSWPLDKKISYALQKLLRFIPTRVRLPKYPQKLSNISNYPGMYDALRGNSSTGAWYGDDGHILLTASLPVQDLKNVLGAVMVQRSGKQIEEAVHDVQERVIDLFLWALLTTLLLSIYLTETIGIPILRLAAAAEKVEQSLLLKDSIPDFSYRLDEIGVLSTQLRRMTVALYERINAIGSFAADVAHEIKNPLASLQSAVETFSLVKDPAQQQKLLSIIADDVERLERLITDISAASRLDSEINHAPKTVFNLAKFLQEVVKGETENLGLKGKLFLDIEKNRRFILSGNEIQIGQVVTNIIQNAASFIPSDGGRITVSCRMQQDKIVVHIDNNGPPVTEGKLETIFERFYSERPPTERFGMHSGLGLSISRQIIRAHKGAIFARNITSDKGRTEGVRFTIILPAEGKK